MGCSSASLTLWLIFRVFVQEIRNLEQAVDSDHTDFVHVDNVYEDVLQQTLDKEVTSGESAVAWSTLLPPHRKCV